MVCVLLRRWCMRSACPWPPQCTDSCWEALPTPTSTIGSGCSAPGASGVPLVSPLSPQPVLPASTLPSHLDLARCLPQAYCVLFSPAVLCPATGVIIVWACAVRMPYTQALVGFFGPVGVFSVILGILTQFWASEKEKITPPRAISYKPED